MVWYSHLLKNFPQFIVIHRVKGFTLLLLLLLLLSRINRVRLCEMDFGSTLPGLNSIYRNNSTNIQHSFNTSFVPGIVLSALHVLFKPFCYYPCFTSVEFKAQIVESI